MQKQNNLNTDNPEQMTFETEELHFTLLGNVKLEGLDRLRVTIKIEVTNRKFEHYMNHPELANLAVRHNLDLYNDMQVEKLIRRASQKLEIATTPLTTALADITDQLELWRLKQIKKKEEQTTTRYKMTNLEQETALTQLQSPNLLNTIKDLIGTSGVIGEEDNRLLIYLIYTSRKREVPLHIISFGSSGTGKTHLQEKVAELIPEEDKIEITSLSENSFYYFEKNELSHKLILIEDLEGLSGTGVASGGGAAYPIRELMSKKRISKTVVHKSKDGKTRTIHLKVDGPISVAGCTTKEKVYEDNANRSFLIYLDESEVQDQKIMDYQRKKSAGLINTDEEEATKILLQNMQRLLKPISVRNPFAIDLQLPKEVFKPRRTNQHYLQFIELVTFLYQHQREHKVDETTGEEYIETTLEDIKQANELIKDILLRKSDVLSGACRNYFERLKTHLKETKLTKFTNRQMSMAFRKSLPTIKRHHQQLYNTGLLNYLKEKKTRTYYYEIANGKDFLTLNIKISKVLESALDKLIRSVKDQKKK